MSNEQPKEQIGEYMGGKREKAIAYAQGLAESSGLELTVEVTQNDADGLTIALRGADAHLFAGRGGQVLDTLQLLALNSLGDNRGGERFHLTFDADDYRVRRTQTLQDLAREVAEEVRSSGMEAELDPMSPLERRIVHNALVEEPGIRTYSEGEEPRRYIVIAPAE
jgi:spoIIIJ-associated protein